MGPFLGACAGHTVITNRHGGHTASGSPRALAPADYARPSTGSATLTCSANYTCKMHTHLQHVEDDDEPGLPGLARRLTVGHNEQHAKQPLPGVGVHAFQQTGAALPILACPSLRCLPCSSTHHNKCTNNSKAGTRVLQG
jgi:hypothetical protein